MTNKYYNMINNDVGLSVLEAINVPTVVIKGKSMIYCNPAALRAELFKRDGRSVYSEFRNIYGRIKAVIGYCDLLHLPTAKGTRMSIVYGRGSDAVVFFLQYSTDIVEAFSYNPDICRDACSLMIRHLLGGECSFKSLTAMILRSLDTGTSYASINNLVTFLDQLVYRITRNQIFQSKPASEEVYIKSDDAYSIISSVAEAVASCRVSNVSLEIDYGKLQIYTDGICCASVPVLEKQFMVGRPFWTTEKDLIISTLILFIATLFYDI